MPNMVVRSPYMSLVQFSEYSKSKTKKRVDLNVLKFLLSKILNRFAITARHLLAQFHDFLTVCQNLALEVGILNCSDEEITIKDWWQET